MSIGGARAGGVGRPDVGADGLPDVLSDAEIEDDSDTSTDGPISYVLVGGEDGADGSGDAGALSKVTSSSSSSTAGRPGFRVRAHPPTMKGIRCIRGAYHEEIRTSGRLKLLLASVRYR